ncbi:hypothetical protein BDN70DRAFT_787245, partial [Pholiota conissans]
AFHNSAQRVDPPRCHPNTREEILKKIYDWIINSEHRKQWLLWLNGAAGAGKSAIMQTLAERCVVAIAVASFFFFRSDATRNTMAPLVATLVYQLIRSIPEISDDILLIIERDPLIFKQALDWQLQHLIIQPLLRLQRVSRQLFVVFIDELDECVNREDQANVIKVLGHVSQKDIPVIFLIASRREPRIQSEFGKKKVADYLEIISLDEIHATDDIRRYLCDKFSDIKSNHIRNHSLLTDWPKYADIEQILAKSSGQFIYAAVVMTY